MLKKKDAVDDVTTIISFKRATDVRHGNEDSDKEDDVIFAKSPFVHALFPLMASVRVFGLFFHRPAHTALTSSLPPCGMLYCLAVTCFAWLNVIFIFSSLRLVKGVDRNMLSVLGGTAWTLLVALNATGQFRTSLNSRYRRRFFCGFARLHLHGGPAFTDPARIKKFTIKLTLAFWLVVACNALFINIGLHVTSTYDIFIANIVGREAVETRSWSSTVYKTMFGIFSLYTSALWLAPTFTEIAVGNLLHSELTLFRLALADKVKQRRYVTEGLEVERKRFQQLTKIVMAADYFLSMHHGASFACNIANICIMLYQLAFFTSTDITSTLALIFWLFACAADIAIVCGVSIVINHDARRVGDHIHDLNVDEVSSGFSLQVALLLRNIDDYFGFTVCRLFLIERPVILSLCGMLITYFLLVVQFASSSSSPSSSCPTSQAVTLPPVECYCNYTANL